MNLSNEIRTVGTAGKLRATLAALAGCALFVVAINLLISATAGEEFSTPVVALILIPVLGAMALPILTQFVRQHWWLDSEGIQERITPLLPWLPFGLRRERHLKWPDLSGCQIVERRHRDKVFHVLHVKVSSPPDIRVYRKARGTDDSFDRFAASLQKQLQARKQAGGART
jgi:hypothetical protein